MRPSEAGMHQLDAVRQLSLGYADTGVGGSLVRLIGLELPSQWRTPCVVHAYRTDPSAHCGVLFLLSPLLCGYVFVWLCIREHGCL